MAYHRPVSAGARNRRHSTIRSNHEIAREEYVEQTLLNKIRRLAAHHARNVEALRSLNGRSAIPKAWADDYQVPLHTEATSPIDTRTRRMSKDDSTPSKPSAPRCVSTSRRSFTRAATSDKSCWAHKPTVVEPFRSMETHATAWKRKIRQQQEVGRCQRGAKSQWSRGKRLMYLSPSCRNHSRPAPCVPPYYFTRMRLKFSSFSSSLTVKISESASFKPGSMARETFEADLHVCLIKHVFLQLYIPKYQVCILNWRVFPTYCQPSMIE